MSHLFGCLRRIYALGPVLVQVAATETEKRVSYEDKTKLKQSVKVDAGVFRDVFHGRCKFQLSPFMCNTICSHCKEVGHSLKRCSTAPVTCKKCNSTNHSIEKCPRIKGNGARKPSSSKGKATLSVPMLNSGQPKVSEEKKQSLHKEKVYAVQSKPDIGSGPPSFTKSGPLLGDSSKAAGKKVLDVDSDRGTGQISDHGKGQISEADPDSSDTLSSEEGEIFEEDFVSEEEHEYLEVVSKRNRRNFRGSSPKLC